MKLNYKTKLKMKILNKKDKITILKVNETKNIYLIAILESHVISKQPERDRERELEKEEATNKTLSETYTKTRPKHINFDYNKVIGRSMRR